MRHAHSGGRPIEILETRTLLSSPQFLTPPLVRHAYGFDAVSFDSNGQRIAADGTGQTIAIVTAFHDPNIVNDLIAFDGAGGLSNLDGTGQFALSVATAQGATVNADWSLEASLDVEWAHAIAPGAHILLVEAASSSANDLLGAVNFARFQPGVVAVSMSWATTEFASESTLDGLFTTPAGHIGGSGLPGGITFVAASGDNGSQAGWPAISPNVLSVGGTILTLDNAGNRISETAWSGSGGGPGTFENSVAPYVSYAADPSTGFVVYDTVPLQGYSGWWSVGGTSAGAPQWAALAAIVDQGRSLQGMGSLDGPTQFIPSLFSLPSSDFNDITSGTNGQYIAASGFDFVTGLGTPRADRIIRDLTPSSVIVSSFSKSASAQTTASPLNTTPAIPKTNASSQSQQDRPADVNATADDWVRQFHRHGARGVLT